MRFDKKDHFKAGHIFLNERRSYMTKCIWLLLVVIILRDVQYLVFHYK